MISRWRGRDDYGNGREPARPEDILPALHGDFVVQGAELVGFLWGWMASNDGTTLRVRHISGTTILFR